jgi:hypothetical protein
MQPPSLTLKALASELKQQVWEDGDHCAGCPNYQRDPDFGVYCESDSCLDCQGMTCDYYDSYIDAYYSPDEQEFLSTYSLSPDDSLAAISFAALSTPVLSLSDATVAIAQYALIRILKEQSSCK